MRTGLFRKEAVDEQANTLDGNFLMTPKPVFSAIALLLIVWIVAVIIYLNMGSYARKASVNGWLEPSHGVFKLYSDTRRGKVIDVLVQDGDQVEAGTPLITIDYSNSDASGNPVSIQLLEEFRRIYPIFLQQRVQHNQLVHLLLVLPMLSMPLAFDRPCLQQHLEERYLIRTLYQIYKQLLV